MKLLLRHTAAVWLAVLLWPRPSAAQEQFSGLCAPVNMVLSQNLTLERTGFQATLQITDNDPNNPITSFAANLTFENPALTSNGVVNDSSSLFFVQPPTFQNISDASGNGVIQPGQTAQISWFLIPTTNAGGTTPNGILYNIGANLRGQINGMAIPSSSMIVLPAPITVRPDAQLQITYFQPRDVVGMDPFTGLGSPIPFTFGVLVQNVGYGTAQNVIIDSQQPKIAQNSNNLLLVAQLLGSRANDSPLANSSLSINVGNLPPNTTGKGAWDMIVSLSGTFLSVSATYTHSSALGGSETSLIKSVNAYLFLHEVLDDLPGRDNIRDFLADTSGALDSVNNLIPDSLYESDGGVYPVNFLANATVSGSSNLYQVSLNASVANWGYLRLNDPGQAKLPIASIVRSDGKVLNTNNYWTSLHYEPVSNLKDTYLNIFDFVSPGSYTYAVTYTNPPPNSNAPVTTLMFAGPSTFTNGAYYVTPATQMYFLTQDANPVTNFDSLNGAPFGLALPFGLSTPGAYQLSFYSVDTSGNQETNHNVTLVLPGPGSLGFDSVSVPSTPFYNPGAALSIRPAVAPISFRASPNPTAVNAQIDIFQGVAGWVTVSNVPSSPTASAAASIIVGGQNVDYYQYQLNTNVWSTEFPVGSPLTLSGLPRGANTLSVLGRSQYGGYLDPGSAVTVAWVVDPAAPTTTITGTPATPAAAGSAQLMVAGAGVTNYQWSINNGYYRAPASVSNPIVLTNLSSAPQVVGVLGEVSGVYQPTNNPTTASWVINPLYGYDLSSLPAVRSVAFTNVAGAITSFDWDGRNGAGVIEPPGWYTVRIALSDGLGNTNFSVSLAQIGAFSGTNQVVADFPRGPQNPYSRGRWVVWQDQSDGNSDIYARDLTSASSQIVQVTHASTIQQNPRTDGRYVVWQAQQANGSWDVYLDDLNGNTGPRAVTSTAGLDEVNPVICWPWVVYQVRPTGNIAAGWQVFAHNMLTSQSFAVSPSTQDEVDADVQAARVVWQDFRDQGPGEIYFSDLQSGAVRRITTNIFGQLHPAIYDNWIVWQDSRNVELDIYGFDLLRNREFQITSTPEDESQPFLNGPWLVCSENSLGPQTGNARLVHLPSRVVVPVTQTPTLKALPTLADGRVVWQETISGQSRVVTAALPALQPVFQNRNVVAVTPDMAAYGQNAYGLLSLWAGSGVQAVTEYTSLVPQVASQTASWNNGTPSGPNYALVAGAFLWVKFNTDQVLDLGVNNTSPLNLSAGANVFGCAGFPDSYSAYQLLRQIGLNNALAVRMLDAQSGRWLVAEVQDGKLVGNDFPIPNVAVLMVNLAAPVPQFTPQAQ